MRWSGIASGAGVSAQAVTKGAKIIVPGDTIVEFNLQQPLVIKSFTAPH